jgi:antitoxin (DNA-binding transcriptional repressor) of toxin-antitoxin stability system
MKTMDASKVRKSFARVLESVRDHHEVFVIVRYGQPLAALVPLDRLSPLEVKVLGRPSPARRRVVKTQVRLKG